MAAALVSEEDAPLDRRTRTLNVANDLAAGDRIKFHFLDELDMKIDNAEIKALYKVLSRRRRTSKLYPYHLRCRVAGPTRKDSVRSRRASALPHQNYRRQEAWPQRDLQRREVPPHRHCSSGNPPAPQTTMNCLPRTSYVRRWNISTAVQARPRPTRRRRLRRRRRRLLPTRTSQSKTKQPLRTVRRKTTGS